MQNEDLLLGASVLAAQRLVDAFGHLSVRTEDGFELVPPPLGFAAKERRFVRMSLRDAELPTGMPGEAWIHWAIYRAKPGVHAVCRAQPRHVLACSGGGIAIRALHGHGAFVGSPVAVFDDARLVRTAGQGEEVAAVLADGNSIVLRGNGAVTVGGSLAEAVARMWCLEASARLNLQTAHVERRPLSSTEVQYWQSLETELLPRIWQYLAKVLDKPLTSSPQEG